MIIKNIIGTLEVDVKKGTIWINSTIKNVLRISGIKFKNNILNFTSIDIKNNDGYLINDQYINQFETKKNKNEDDNIIELLINIGDLLYNNNLKIGEYNKLWLHIIKFFNDRNK